MLWDPRQSAEEITREYCRYWFGPEARDEMARAIMLMEETLERPVRGNLGIARAVKLIRSAGGKIPQNLMEHDYRWRIIAQKALIDLYLQLKLARGDRLKNLARPFLEEARRSTGPGPLIEKALSILTRPKKTPGMLRIKEEALALGEESNRIIGYRVPACLTVDDLDLTELDWWASTLEEGLSAGERRMRNAISMALDYENPGEGGYFDRFGWPSIPRSLDRTGVRWMFIPFKGPARLSHYGLAYPHPRKGRAITLVYHGLKAGADYRLRALIRGHRTGRPITDEDPGQAEVSVTVNGKVIGEGLRVGGKPEFIELDIPEELTESGTARISLLTDSAPPAMGGLSDFWVMRRKTMPWTVPDAGVLRPV